MAPRHKARVGRLTRRPEFLAVAGTRRKQVTPGVIIQARAHDAQQRPQPGEPPVRVGFTASKKVGGAVDRNRARRRLRAAMAEVLAPNAAPGHDYVLIARPDTVRRPYSVLKADVEHALKRLKVWQKPSGQPAESAPSAAPSQAAETPHSDSGRTARRNEDAT